MRLPASAGIVWLSPRCRAVPQGDRSGAWPGAGWGGAVVPALEQLEAELEGKGTRAECPKGLRRAAAGAQSSGPTRDLTLETGRLGAGPCVQRLET